MCKHETRICPRCAGPFECKAGTITQCQCSAIRLTEGERAYISSRFDDCLCIGCLQALREEYGRFTEACVFGKRATGSL